MQNFKTKYKIATYKKNYKYNVYTYKKYIILLI